jgi:O-antigen/teichoic acid export membrane protein
MTSPPPRTVIVAKNTVWNLTAKGADFLGNLAASILIARVLGVEGFGLFSFVVAFATIFSMGMDWGLDHILVREISRRSGSGRPELSTVLGLKFLFLLILIPVLVAANQSLTMTQGVRTAIYLAAVGIMVFRVGFTRIAEGVFLARDSLNQKTLATVLYQLVRLAGVAAVLWLGGNLVLLFAALLAADLFQTALVGIWVHNRHIPVSIRFNKQDVGFFFLRLCRLRYPCSATVPISSKTS